MFQWGEAEDEECPLPRPLPQGEGRVVVFLPQEERRVRVLLLRGEGSGLGMHTVKWGERNGVRLSPAGIFPPRGQGNHHAEGSDLYWLR